MIHTRKSTRNFIHMIPPFSLQVFKPILFALCVGLASFSNAQIQLDNQFNDWSTVPHVEAGDGAGSFVSLGVSSNNLWLFVHITLTNEVGLDEDVLPNELKILLDLDNDIETGVNYAGLGLGVDLLIDLPNRQAIRYSGGSGSESLNEIGLHVSPTYSADEFELAFHREQSQITAPELRLMWYDGETGEGFPNGGSLHALNDAVAPWQPQNLSRAEGTLNRVAFWNMNNRIDQSGAQASMERILQAINPDIIGFSEVSDASTGFVQGLLNQWLPLEAGATWNVIKDDYDLMVASKGSILEGFSDLYRQFPVIVEGHPGWGVPLLFTSSHLKCCGGASSEAQRQSEADEYMAFLREAISGEVGTPLIPTNTPIIYGGDLNMVGLDNPIYTLITGDISDEDSYGEDFIPDWDGSHFKEWPILQSESPMDFTWTNNSSEWMPGKLDYLITSDASANVLHSFTLRTDIMNSNRLTQFGLQSGDALAASDHYIIVADLGIGAFTGTFPDSDNDGINDSLDNCINIANPNQADFNDDGFGDDCSDFDGDGISDALEIYLYNTNPLETDSDGDGIVDGLELCVCANINQCPGDLTNDLVVNVGDLLLLLGFFGSNC
jgi:hypothetical protein